MAREVLWPAAVDLDFSKDDDGDRETPLNAGSRDGRELTVLARRWAALLRFRAASHQLPHGFFHRYTALAESLIRKQRRPLGPPFAIFGRHDDNAADPQRTRTRLIVPVQASARS